MYPEKDSQIYSRRTVHGNSSYSNIGKKDCTLFRIKTVIISDSIPKRIDMREFNDLLKNGAAYKRAFSGATASQLNHYVKATLVEDKPDSIIICAGTNNLTKKQQTVQETTKEIISIAETCRHNGVNTIYISSLICRPSHQKEINDINNVSIVMTCFMLKQHILHVSLLLIS